MLTLAAEVQGVLLKGELLYVLDSTSGHIFSWLHQKKHFFCLGEGSGSDFFFGLLEDEEVVSATCPGWS